MADHTTKILLSLIVLGLWMNLAVPIFTPKSVTAQDFSGIERMVRNIEGNVSSIERDVDDIEDGTCLNRKLCN